MDATPYGAIVSFPKCGRTWLRLMLSKCLAVQAGQPHTSVDMSSMFAWLPNADANPTKGMQALWSGGAPTEHRIVAAHDARWLDRVERPLLLLRDPAETLVSLYYHRTKHQQRDEISFSDFFWHGQDVPKLFAFLDRAAAADPHTTAVLTYDHLLASTAECLGAAIDHFGVPRPNGTVLAGVVQACSFDNMLQDERHSEFQRSRGYDASDPNAWRVRSGQADRGVGLFTDELRTALKDRIAAAVEPASMARLQSFGSDGWSW